MPEIKIHPYDEEDNEEALALEAQCAQGKSLRLRFLRPRFAARSEVYENFAILCAREEKKLVGVIAGSLKPVRLHGEDCRALYVFDLRVHPEYRRMGVGRKLGAALIDGFGKEADCIYTLINGHNERAYRLACRYFAPRVIIPLTYIVIPVYRKILEEGNAVSLSASEVHEYFLRSNPDVEFLTTWSEDQLKGHVQSYILKEEQGGGCSVWTNENLLAEQVMGVPFSFRLLRVLSSILRPLKSFPSIPDVGEVIKSWFLYDFFAGSERGLRNLLVVASNRAFEKQRTFLYLLLQNRNPLLARVRKAGFRHFTFPYFFLAKGDALPSPEDPVYIDIRDL